MQVQPSTIAMAWSSVVWCRNVFHGADMSVQFGTGASTNAEMSRVRSVLGPKHLDTTLTLLTGSAWIPQITIDDHHRSLQITYTCLLLGHVCLYVKVNEKHASCSLSNPCTRMSVIAVKVRTDAKCPRTAYD